MDEKEPMSRLDREIEAYKHLPMIDYLLFGLFVFFAYIFSSPQEDLEFNEAARAAIKAAFMKK